jgi:FemAB-related protein (PEP-CTERM system-associated)
MNIRLASDSDKQRWNNFVQNQVLGSAYHLSAWTKAIQNAYGFKSFNLIAEENNEIMGVFPLTMLKIPFKRPDLVALPYCDVGAPLAISDEVQNELLRETIPIAKSNNVSTIEIRGEINHDFLQQFGYSLQAKSSKVRMLLQLPNSSEMLWKGFTSKLRSQIRKAEKNGLSFKFSEGNIDDFYSVFKVNMHDLGSPVHSKKWFEEIIRGFADNVRVGVVHNEERAIGAGIILKAGDKIAIPWASTLKPFNRLSPNMLLYWKFLEYAADNGARIFDFGRSTQDEGTYNFKKQWGAKPETLTWYTLFLDNTTPKITTKPSNYRDIAKRNWQRLPPGFANFLGPVIRKYIRL